MIEAFEVLDGNERKCAYKRTSSPLFRIDASAASSIFTTRKPAWPSLKGVLLVHDAVREVIQFHMQCFELLQLEAPTYRPVR